LNFNSTSFSGLLIYTYFLRAFFESKDRAEMLQITTHHRITFDDDLPLIAQPPHVTSSSTTLPSSSPSLHGVKFPVCCECRIYFWQGLICNISEIETHLRNLLRSWCCSDGELSNSLVSQLSWVMATWYAFWGCGDMFMSPSAACPSPHIFWDSNPKIAIYKWMYLSQYLSSDHPVKLVRASIGCIESIYAINFGCFGRGGTVSGQNNLIWDRFTRIVLILMGGMVGARILSWFWRPRATHSIGLFICEVSNLFYML
jgi:hypothetical protein